MIEKSAQPFLALLRGPKCVVPGEKFIGSTREVAERLKHRWVCRGLLAYTDDFLVSSLPLRFEVGCDGRSPSSPNCQVSRVQHFHC